MIKNKITSVMLAALMAASMIPTTALADSAEAGSGQSSDVKLVAEALTFNVTIPTVLPVDVNNLGEVTVATNVQITNNSAGPVSVSKIDIVDKNGWVKVDKVSDKVGLSEYTLDVSTADQSVGAKGSTKVNYASTISPQKEAISNLVVAEVIFTIGWDSNGSTGGGSGESHEYILATDADFSGTADGSFKYIGTDKYVEIPHIIKGIPVTSYYSMFNGTSVEGVKSTNTNITNMSYMFQNSAATTLDLSSFDTSNVTSMAGMFSGNTATTLDLSSFDTSKVTNMNGMFYYSKATTLDLSSFDTSRVTNMYCMFQNSKATTLDLSSFNTSNVTDMDGMLYGSAATTGYAKTQADANKFNASSEKPSTLTFVVK